MSADRLQLLKQQAMDLMRANRLAEAKAILSRVCEQSADDVDAWYLLSCIHGMQGSWEEAGRCCRRVIALRPDHSDAHINLGNVLFSQGRPSDAALEYQAALRTNPNHGGALCSLGNVLASLGDHRQAAEQYKAALRVHPNFVEAYYNLGNSQMALEEYGDAADSFRHAIRLNPNYAPAYNNLGSAHKALGEIDAATENYRNAVRLQPDFADAYNNLAIVLREQGQLDEACDAALNAVRVRPGFAQALFNLGNVYMDQDHVERAVSCLERAIDADPAYAEAHNNLGMALMKQGKIEQAKDEIQRALAIRPAFAEALSNLGSIEYSLGSLGAAVDVCRRAIALDSEFAEAHIHLGNALLKQGQVSEAVECYERALALRPDSAEAHGNLAAALNLQGRWDEAERMAREALRLRSDLVQAYSTLDLIYFAQGRLKESNQMGREVLRLDPDNAVANDNLLMGMHYDPDYSSEQLFLAAREWGARHDLRGSLPAVFVNAPDAGRRLRIGYVSGHFKTHPVGIFLEQVLAHHDRDGFEIFCYSNQAGGDDLTGRLRGHADHWKDILYRTDEQLAADIRGDGIDILVDLEGHTSGNRLLVFSRKPAPVQATWIGYHATTGLPAMDYIFGDRVLIPAEEERYYVEKVVRLPNAYLCFSPPDIEVEPGPLPALATGNITFGCFNNPAKLTEPVIACWSRLLQALPGAQIHLKYNAFRADEVRRRYRAAFAGHGIDTARIRFSGASPRRAYLQAYQGLDICLDPFPFNGCTTTLESLWMGVPVVTLRGDRYAGHMGETILTHVGLEEYVTDSEDSYIARAVALAGDPARIAELRAGLRGRLLDSPLCDGPTFTRDLERVYRRTWAAWCSAQITSD